jgi:hypothetical protein
MTLAGPRDSTIAIVGDGFGSALVYTTAVYLGFQPEQITVYGPNANPEQGEGREGVSGPASSNRGRATAMPRANGTAMLAWEMSPACSNRPAAHPDRRVADEPGRAQPADPAGVVDRVAEVGGDLLAGPGDGDHGPGVDCHGASSGSGGAVG